MMSLNGYQMKTREVRGNLPALVAIKEPKRRSAPPDARIQKMRVDQEDWEDATSRNRSAAVSDLRNDWQRNTDRKIANRNLSSYVDRQMADVDARLEMRRDRLRCLLSSDQERYQQEFFDGQETVLERQAKLRERARLLKQEKAEDLAATVAVKEEQRFRDQCEELRSLMSKKKRQELAVDHKEQIRIKQCLAEKRREKEELLAQFQGSDLLAKEGRDEQDLATRKWKDCKNQDYIMGQMGQVKAKETEEQRLKEEEGALLRQHLDMLEMEKQREMQEKERKQAETRGMLDLSKRQRLSREMAEREREMAADLTMLERVMTDAIQEQEDTWSKKQRLWRELQQYREYLRLELERQRCEDKDLDRYCQEEQERMWHKKCLQWKAEREARKALLNEVVAHQKEQISEKLARNAGKKEAALRERDNVLRELEQLRVEDAAARERLHDKRSQHASHLLQQMDFNSKMKCFTAAEHERERIAGHEAEDEYQDRLASELTNSKFSNLHPIRKTDNYSRSLAQVIGC